MPEFKRIKNQYDKLEAERQQNMPLMRDIAKFAGINADDSFNGTNVNRDGLSDLDDDVYDPTSAIAINQSGDFLTGVLWHPDAIDLVPNRIILNKLGGSAAEVEEYYKFISEQLLFHMNHANSGFMTALRPYSYDQAAFGTSGISAFINPGFADGVDENAIYFNNFGVDKLAIAEGRNGRIETAYITYHWTASRIVSELGVDNDGEVTEKSLSKLPQAIRKAFASKDDKRLFKTVFGAFPRGDFKPGLRGRRGKRFTGVWFFPDHGKDIVQEIDYTEFPLPVARAVRIRNSVYGRSPGTILLSAIRGVNFMLGSSFEVMDKINRPALGVFGSAISGDTVLDTSADSLTVFNPEATEGRNPVFNVSDAGDPSPILNFLVPFLNEKITQGFKLDSILDFNTERDVTATESLQRFSIRGKTMSGILTQQKIEMIEPIVRRAADILLQVGEFGLSNRVLRNNAKMAEARGHMPIPDVVRESMEAGLPWFDIRFNNDMEKLLRTEKVDGLIELLNVVGAVSNFKPSSAEMIDEYSAVDEFRDNRVHDTKALKTRRQYEQILQQLSEARAQQQGIQAAKDAAEVSRTEGFAEQARAKAESERKK